MDGTPPTLLFAGARLSGTRPARIRLRSRGARILLADDPDDGLRRAVVDLPDLVALEENEGGGWPADWVERLQYLRPDVDVVVVQSGAPARLSATGRSSPPVSPARLVDLVEARYPGRLLPPAPRAASRIVCVDDDPRWLSALRRMLVPRGYDVALFDNAPAALESVQRATPRAAVVDLMMPGMDGLDLTERIGERVPVVLLTALDTDEACHEGHRRGARYFLAKTSDPARLVDVVDLLAADLDESERSLIRSRL
ncbi:MAG TPA: response regulator [Planctomycetota bacterium]|nr:response regulator [Planctomycetota bacterium]